MNRDGQRECSNYVFDFYGTLVEVHTDENKPSLWRFMADWYAVHGCLLPAESLRDAFWRTESREREGRRRQTGLECPEIRIERVFLRLLLESPARPCSTALEGRPVGEWRQRHLRDPESALRVLENGDWAEATARAFRILSRDFLRPYPDTLPTLRELVRRGKRLFLLSNAQAAFTRPEIAQTGLAEFFPAPCLSSESGMMKPQREFLDSLLLRENLSPRDTVLVGNEMRSDMAIALRCGVDAIFLNTAGHDPERLREESRQLLAAEKAPDSSLPRLLLSGRLRDLLP